MALDKRSNTSKGSTKYVAGGGGIHRPVALSVKSGYSNTTKTTSYGKEYQSKKAGGDVKRKGKLEPYAYIPVSRSMLNKRKQAKNQSQFKGVVKKSRKNAAAGSKNRLLKKK
jgi:ribosomal RNA-processing protein 12